MKVGLSKQKGWGGLLNSPVQVRPVFECRRPVSTRNLNVGCFTFIFKVSLGSKECDFKKWRLPLDHMAVWLHNQTFLPPAIISIYNNCFYLYISFCSIMQIHNSISACLCDVPPVWDSLHLHLNLLCRRLHSLTGQAKLLSMFVYTFMELWCKNDEQEETIKKLKA